LITYLPDSADDSPPMSDGTDPRSLQPASTPLSPTPRTGVRRPPGDRPRRRRGLRPRTPARVRKEILTAFARIDGRPVGIVANQPNQRAGAIFPDAAEKAAQFVWTCDAYDVPCCTSVTRRGSWPVHRSRRRASSNRARR